MRRERAKRRTQKDVFLLTVTVKVRHDEVKVGKERSKERKKREMESEKKRDSMTVWHLTGSMDKYKQYIGRPGMRV